MAAYGSPCHVDVLLQFYQVFQMRDVTADELEVVADGPLFPLKLQLQGAAAD